MIFGLYVNVSAFGFCGGRHSNPAVWAVIQPADNRKADGGKVHD
jgi:hypothetical protein